MLKWSYLYVEIKWPAECSNKLQCEPPFGASVSTLSKGSSISNVLFILLNQEGCNRLIPQGRKSCHLQPCREETLTSFPYFNYQLERRFFILSSGGLFKNKRSKNKYGYTQIYRYIFTCLCIQYLWRDARGTGNTGWVAEKGEGGGGEGESQD